MEFKRVFYNRFNRASDVKRKLSNVDCVDRLSYVDPTQLVKRFINEGKNLAMYRAQSLYKSYEDAAHDSDAALPVFEEDIAITHARLKAAEDEMQKRLSEKASSVKTEGVSNPSSTKADSAASVSGQSEGAAVV